MLSDKSMSIIKSLNSKQSKGKATSNKIKTPTQGNNNNLSKGGIINANKQKEQAPQTTLTAEQPQKSLAELRRNYPIAD